MPLFGRRLFHLPKDDSKANDTTVYTIEHTGDTYHNHELYEKLNKIYNLQRWTCECTWKAGLTHKEAYQSESETRKTLSTLVPNYYNKPIFDIIYHNVKPLEKLAEEVSIVLGQSFFLDELVQFKKRKDTTIIKGIIERIEDNDDSKKRTSERTSVQSKLSSDKQMKNVKYSVRLLDDNSIVNNVLPSELQRSNLLPNREKLKTFIRSYAIRLGNRVDSPWIFYDSSNKDKYDLKDRISSDIIEKFIKSTKITLDEIIRERDKIARKQADENIQLDDIQIILSDDDDDDDEREIKHSKPKSPSKPKKQLTLHDMKFTKNSTNHNDLLEKSSTTTYDIAVPYALLQKLDKARRERGIDSKFFQRIILNCARTLNEKQRLRLPDEYRSLIQMKYDELELKRRLSQMTDDERKLFLQTKRLEQRPIEDLDLTSNKDLPQPKELQTTLSISSNSIGDLLMICTFLTSCHSLFSLSLNDDISKTMQIYLRSFKLDCLLNVSSTIFTNYFIEILQIFMKLLFKEDENRSNNDDNDDDNDNDDDDDDDKTNIDEKKMTSQHRNDKNNNENIDIDKDIEKIYSIHLYDIPLTSHTCQELTRLFLLKENKENNKTILDKLATCETKDFTVSEQIEILILLVNTITTDNELMSDYFESLTRTMSEASRERNQLIAERRKAQEEESKQKKLQLQNGENEKISSKKQTKTRPLITPNDENQNTSPMIVDENGDIHNSNDDDLKSVLQRRRQMVAMSKELKEKRELEAQKLALKQKRQLAIQKAEQIYQEALVNLQYGFRVKPLGFDRNYNRYWFFRGYPGLFVEKGWIDSNINYSNESSSIEMTLSNNGEKLIPKYESNQWFVYDDEIIIQQLLNSLNDRGIREHNLLVNFKKAMPLIHGEFEQMKKSKLVQEETDENVNSSNDIITSFKIDLEDIETRLRLGSLGGFMINDNLSQWQNKLKQTNERIVLAELLIQLQQTVADKYASGLFSMSDKKSLQIWLNDCRTCKTFSRLYVLMMIFENSITWNKSTLGMKCKICRKKHKEEYIIVCDQCCYGFHQECLRDYSDNIKTSNNELWYCPACRPSTSRRRTKQNKNKVTYYENDDDDDDDEMEVETTSNTSSNAPNTQRTLESNSDNNDENDTENDEDRICCICGDENNLIQCTQCRQCYHCHCHEPPLRCSPRTTTWICNSCRNGITIKSNYSSRKLKKNVKITKQIEPRIQTRRSMRKNDLQEESDDDQNLANQRRSKRLRRSDPSSIKSMNNNQQRPYRGCRRDKSISSSSSSSIENNQDDNDSLSSN